MLYPTVIARTTLASRLGLAYSDSMQDWEWEVANSARLIDFLAAHSDSDLSAGERFSLMEVLVQCVEDSKSRAFWNEIEPFLHANPRLHISIIEYLHAVARQRCDMALDPTQEGITDGNHDLPGG